MNNPPKWKTRLVEGEFPGRDFDIEFWHEQGDEAISAPPGFQVGAAAYGLFIFNQVVQRSEVYSKSDGQKSKRGALTGHRIRKYSTRP